MGWNTANLIGVMLVLTGLISCSIALGAGASMPGSVVAIGAAAGLASALPIWWSFFKGGVHNIFGMSREAAWRIHIAFGHITLLFALAHGVLAFIVHGIDIV